MEIHDIVYYGGGGFTYEQVSNMPVWLRKFTYNRIYVTKQKENESKSPKDPKQTELNLFNPQQEFTKQSQPKADYISKTSKK